MKKHAPPPPSFASKILANRKRLSIAGVLLAAVIYFAQADIVYTTFIDNGVFFIGNYEVVDENLNHPRLQLLRRREQLDKVIAPGETQLAKVLLLLDWAHRQLHTATKFYYPPWDAVEILDLARKYGNGGFCAQYAIIMLQACQAVGLDTRYVDLPGHFAMAVWFDDYEKWVYLDPYNDFYFEKDGIPLGGATLYDAYHDKKIDGIFKVTPAGVKTQIVLQDLSVFDKYSIVLRNNQLTEPEAIEVNGRPRKLSLASDYTSYPLFGRDNITIRDNFLSYKALPGQNIENRRWTSDTDDFRNDQDQTMIYYSQSKKDDRAIKVMMIPINTVNFKDFLINANNTGWQEAPDKLIWAIEPGLNTLQARTVDQFGWKGVISTVRLYYKPPWFFRHEKRQEEGHGRFVKSI